MRLTRRAAGALVGAVALTASVLGADAAPATPTAAGTAARAAEPQGGGGEYVISYAGNLQAAEAAVTSAGGEVVDVIDELDLALAETDSATFAQEVDASAAVTGVVRNHSVGMTQPGQAHRFVEERPSRADRAAAGATASQNGRRPRVTADEPLAGFQWDMNMIGATPTQAHRRATGRGVRVGIIDTGIDGTHPELIDNLDVRASRNFTTDIPAVDGPCEVPSCVDDAVTDDNGHGTHVAGTVGAPADGFGIHGVAPDATLVNLRAGQDSGFFFLWESVKALTTAGITRLDVVNMSYYVDPWLYNCNSRDDYVSGDVSDAELAEQAQVRRFMTLALEFAHARGVTLVAAAGNGHTDLSTPTRFDATSPDYPPGSERDRTVTDDCLDLPSEGPHVISVSSVGPTGTKSDFSNYGSPEVEVAAPGGWFRDGFGTPTFQTPGNLILSSYPIDVAIEEGLANPDGTPVDGFSQRYCAPDGTCGFYTTLQGTSMASPHAVGVAALIIEEHGRGNPRQGFSLNPNTVRRILRDTARDHACPAGGFEDYSQEGRPPEYNAICTGNTDENSLYGEGIVNAAAAVR